MICSEYVYYILHSTYMRLFYLVSDNFGNIGKMNVRLHKAPFLITLFDRPHLMHLLLRFSVHILNKYIHIALLPHLNIGLWQHRDWKHSTDFALTGRWISAAGPRCICSYRPTKTCM